MATRPIKRATSRPEQSYPSLKQHVANRRRFLAVAGASVAAGGLWAACTRGLGSAEGIGPAPDAQVGPDAEVFLAGDVAEPEYFLLRIPVSGDISAYLSDGGYCTFFVELATYSASTYDTLTQNMDEAADRCRALLVDYTYDGLSTAAGVAAAEDDLLGELDDLVGEIEGHNLPTVELVTLTISYLEPVEQLDGGIGEPQYP